jgi:uncharacterized protein
VYVIELAFGDDPRRLQARPAHRELLKQLHADGRLFMSGPWDDDSGALLILDTDEAGVDEIMAADPYFESPGVTVMSVRHWTPLFGRP